MSITTYNANGDGTAAKDYLPLYDGLWNVVGLLDAASGTLVATYEYDPFGNYLSAPQGDPEALAANPFGFATQYRDAETGLYCFAYRYYSPTLGRWMTRDPIAEDGGVNLYAYCQNDPMNRVDPLGMADQFTLNLQADDLRYAYGSSFDLGTDPFALILHDLQRSIGADPFANWRKSDGRYAQASLSAQAQVALYLGHQVNQISNAIELYNIWIGQHRSVIARLEKQVAADPDLAWALNDRRTRLQINLAEREQAFSQLSQVEGLYQELGLNSLRIPAIPSHRGSDLWGTTGGYGLDEAAYAARTMALCGRGPGVASTGDDIMCWAAAATSWLRWADQVAVTGGRLSLVHMTTKENFVKIYAKSPPVLKGDIYAGPLCNAEAKGLFLTLRTGLPATHSQPILIPESALGAFTKPLPIGPFCIIQRLQGARYTARGELDLLTGAFRRTGVNWSQVKIYICDLTIDLGAAWILKRTRDYSKFAEEERE